MSGGPVGPGGGHELMPRLLVAGPPCGGKTTYARRQAGPDEILLDFDDLMEATTGNRYSTSEMDRRIVREQFRALLPTADVVIWTAPRRIDRGRFRAQFGARTVVVMASMGECLRRAREERPRAWERAVRDWFAQYEPSRSGSDVVVWTQKA